MLAARVRAAQTAVKPFRQTLPQRAQQARMSNIPQALFGTQAKGGLYDIKVQDIDNKELPLSKFAGKVRALPGQRNL